MDTASFRAEKYTGTQHQFHHVLAAVLLGEERDEETQGVEAIVKIPKTKVKKKTVTALHVIIQKRIEGITQKYGQIELTEDDAEDNLFNWGVLAVELKDNITNEARELRAQLQAKEEESAKLKEAMEELVVLKKAHEDELIEKFAALLNEKKLKVRDQQRIINSAIPDSQRLAAVEAARAEDHSPGPSRERKRKPAVKNESEDEMEVDVDVNAGNSDGANTPDRSTEDEAEAEERDVEMADSTSKENSKPALVDDEDAELPPKRDLPFSMRQKSVSKTAAKPAADDGSETESDNEL